MYINFWYAAERSEKLTADKPLRVRMLSHEFVLFRDSKGKAHCLSDTCIHRGAALSGGKVMATACSARITAGSTRAADAA